jgi:hypothetical protein
MARRRWNGGFDSRSVAAAYEKKETWSPFELISRVYLRTAALRFETGGEGDEKNGRHLYV